MHLRRWGLALLVVTGLTGCIRVTADARSEAEASITGPGTGGGTEQCRNGIDDADSEDTLADMADPGCHWDGNASNSVSYNPYDNDESNSTSPALEQCRDTKDNDGDGLVDYPADPGCSSPTDNDETNTTNPALEQCRDGIDNADPEDTLIDAADPGCHSDGNANNPSSYVPTDNDETNSISGSFSVTPEFATFRVGVGCTPQPITFSASGSPVVSASASDNRVALVTNGIANTIVATWNAVAGSQPPAWVLVTFRSALGLEDTSQINFDYTSCQTQNTVTVIPSTLTLYTVGCSTGVTSGSVQLQLNGQTVNSGVNWTSSNTSIATVSPNGVVTAGSTAGTVIITGAISQGSASATVTVMSCQQPPATCSASTIQFSPNPISVRVGQTVRVNVMNWQLSFNSDCIPWGDLGDRTDGSTNGNFSVAIITASEILWTPANPPGSPSYRAGRWIDIQGRVAGTTRFCYQAGITDTSPRTCTTLTVTP